MSDRKPFEVEVGFGIAEKNGDLAVYQHLVGAALPGGDGGLQDAAPIGSLYSRSGTSETYKKIANAGAQADWELFGQAVSMDQTFREECIRVASGDTFGDGARDLSLNPFTDDDGNDIDAADFVVGDFVLLGVGSGTVILKEVTAVSAPTVTFSTPDPSLALVAGNNFVVKNYLPDDPNAQEGLAIVHYNGTDIVKISDQNWNFADGIGLASSYAAASGDISAADTVQSAIEKLDGNNDAQDTLLGTVQGATDLGTFAGDIIGDNQTVKGALSDLENAVEGEPETLTGVNASTVLDSVLVDKYRSVIWLVTAFDESAPNATRSFLVHATNDGTSAADAVKIDDNLYSQNRLNGNFNRQVDVVLSGAGATQTMDLTVNTSEAGVTFTSTVVAKAESGY